MFISIMYNSQDMEATQVPINRWMDKEDVVHRHDGILLSYKKEGYLVICYNVDRTRGYHAKWNKSEEDKYHMISLIWSKIQNKQKLTFKYWHQTVGYHGGVGRWMK